MGTCQLAQGRVRPFFHDMPEISKSCCKADQPKITATNAGSVFVTDELRIVAEGQEITKGRP